MSLSPPERALLDRVADQDAAMREHVRAWVAVNSGSRNLDGLAQVAAMLAQAFGRLGPVDLREPAPADAVGADGTVRPLVHGRNLHLVVRPDASVRALLTGHMDTVFAADHSFQTLHEDGERWNGPGAADMKGGLAVMLAALSALDMPDLGFEVVINSDEEVSSLGSAPLLAEAAARCHLGLTFEPALPDGTLAGARRGSGNFTATIRGRAAHAGRNPDEGRNAVVAAADLALRLAGLRADDLSVNVAKIDGGGPNNVVPDLAMIRFNLRPASHAAQARGAAAVDAALAAVAAAHDVEAKLHGGFARPPKPMDANQRRLFDLVRDCGAALGQPIAWRDTGGVCDGNNLAATGLAVVDTMGPLGGAIHSDAEYLLAASLVPRAQLAALTLHRAASSGWSRAA